MDRFYDVRIVCVYKSNVEDDFSETVRNEKVTVKAENPGFALDRALRFFRPDDYAGVSIKQAHVLCD